MTLKNNLKRKYRRNRTARKKGGFLRELFTSDSSVSSKAPTCEPSANDDGCSQYNNVSQIQQQGRSDDQYGSNAQPVESAPESSNKACNGQSATTCSNNNYNESQNSYNQSKSSTSGRRAGGRRKKKKKSLKKRKRN